MNSFEKGASSGLSWGEKLLPHWAEVKADFLERYNHDLDYGPLRSWHWLVEKIVQLLTLPPTYIRTDKELIPVHQTRLGHALYPPNGKG